MADDRESNFFDALFEWAEDLYADQPLLARTKGQPVPRIPVRLAIADGLHVYGGVIRCDGGVLDAELSVLPHDLDYANQTLESALQVDWGHLAAVLTFRDAEGQLFHLVSHCPDSALCIPEGTAVWPLDGDERYRRQTGSPYTPDSFFHFGLGGDDLFDLRIGFAPVSTYGRYMSWRLEASEAIGFVDCVICISMQAGEFESIPFPLYFRHRVPVTDLLGCNTRPQSDGWPRYHPPPILRQSIHPAVGAAAGDALVELRTPEPPASVPNYQERYLGARTDLGLIDWFRTQPEPGKPDDIEVNPDRELRFRTMLVTPMELGERARFLPVGEYYARELYGQHAFIRRGPDPEPHRLVVEHPFSWRTFPRGVWDPTMRLAPAEYVFRERPELGRCVWSLGIRDRATTDVWHCGGVAETEFFLPSEGTSVETGAWLWGDKPDLDDLATQLEEDERRFAHWPRLAEHARIEYERAVKRGNYPWGLPLTFARTEPLNLMLNDRSVAIDLQDNVRCSYASMRPDEQDLIEAKLSHKTFGTVRLAFEGTDVISGERVRFRHAVPVNPLIAPSSTITVPHDPRVDRPSWVTLYY